MSGHLLDRPKPSLLLGLHVLTEPPAHNVCGRVFFISGRRPPKVEVKALLCSSKLLLWRAIAECVFLILYPNLIFVACMRCQKGFSAALLLKGQCFHVWEIFIVVGRGYLDFLGVKEFNSVWLNPIPDASVGPLILLEVRQPLHFCVWLSLSQLRGTVSAPIMKVTKGSRRFLDAFLLKSQFLSES